MATIGIFDGVHTGHRYILEQLKEQSRLHGGESVVVTLWPHPRIVLGKDANGFRLLHSKEEKIRKLEKCGIDHLVIVPFNREVASLHACEFIMRYLVEKIGVEVLVMGYDNRFGSDRMGDPDGLAKCAGSGGFRIVKLSEYNPDKERVSSTAIREFILSGDLAGAARMLGYNYYLAGTIREGNHLGRKIGYPTANIDPDTPYKLIPMNGVYAIQAELRGELFNGMLNIGFRPTIDSASAVKTVEAHLFDVSGDFYSEQIVIHFIKRIRDEMKFRGVDELKRQLDKDNASIRQLFHV